MQEVASRVTTFEQSLVSGYEDADSTVVARLVARKDGVFDAGGDAEGVQKLNAEGVARPDYNVIDIYATTVPHEPRVSSEAKKESRIEQKRIDEEVGYFVL